MNDSFWADLGEQLTGAAVSYVANQNLDKTPKVQAAQAQAVATGKPSGLPTWLIASLVGVVGLVVILFALKK